MYKLLSENKYIHILSEVMFSDMSHSVGRKA